MEAGVKAVRQAIASHKKIWIYGDYDADGMTAAALLIKALASLGSKADCYIPHRIDEGYGLHKEAIRAIRGRGAELLITVDCGISCVEEASYAESIGLPLVITDHHQPPPILPEALALINPELMEDPAESRGMSGAGVAFAFAYCLYQDAGCEKAMADFMEFTQLAAIGTLADSMPLTGDNRILTAFGLAQINQSPVPGIRALALQGGLEGKSIKEDHVTYTFAPRLNAAGRMDDPALGLALLLAEDVPAADPFAARLSSLNKQRQDLDNVIYQEIIRKIEGNPELTDKPVLILSGEGWHLGVIGITAARLMEKYHKPVILISFSGELGKGSGRSLPSFPLYHALSEASPVLLAFGGHELACGLQISRENLDAFCEIVGQNALSPGEVYQEATAAAYTADLAVSTEQLTLAALEELEGLAPFGTGNPKPLFVLNAMRLMDRRALGQEKRHYQLRFQPTQEGGEAGGKRGELTAIAFSMEDTMLFPETGEIYDLLFQPEINAWQGRRSVRAILRDIRESRPCAGGSGGAAETAAHASAVSPGPAHPDAGYLDQGPEARDWERYRERILGGYSYREKQIEALNALAAGKNTMLLMATGRGKTAVFQTAITALCAEKISIVIYPLRSLARDQMNRMEKVLKPMGIRTALAWGGLDHWEKRIFFNDLYQGRIHLVISTAEFLQAHVDKFSAVTNRIGLFVVDEAHHLGAGDRQAYKDLRNTWIKLGRPLLLATTATADDVCAAKVVRDFDVKSLIAEDHCRENLAIVDARGKDSEGKLAYLLHIADRNSKMIVYANSRPLTEELSRVLQDKLPWMREHIGYYHGGLLPDARQEAERAFLHGDCRIMVSTSAFGEGADIPDIRDVALYHLCFSRAEYNQLSGRAGRDGLPARIHLLYGKKDQDLNRLLLREEAPDREVLGVFYLLLREKAASANPLALSDETMAEEMARRGYSGFTARTAQYCLGILEEIALLLREQEEGRRDIHLAPPPPAKLDLKQSSLYMEGLKNTTLFEEYAALAFSADLPQLLAGINRPILPEMRKYDGQ